MNHRAGPKCKVWEAGWREVSVVFLRGTLRKKDISLLTLTKLEEAGFLIIYLRG